MWVLSTSGRECGLELIPHQRNPLLLIRQDTLRDLQPRGSVAARLSRDSAAIETLGFASAAEHHGAGGPGEQSPEGRPSEAGPWMAESRPEGGAAWPARRTLASPPQAQSLKGPWMALQAYI